MLSSEDLQMWRLGLSQAARGVIDQIRFAPPSRRVGGGHQNVSGCCMSAGERSANGKEKELSRN